MPDNKMIIDKNQVEKLIPQKAPMAMVDGLLQIDESSATSRLILTPSNIFCGNGVFKEPGLIENMAQSAALQSAYQAKLNNSQPKIGFIGSVKRFKINSLPKDNDTLFTTVSILTQIANATIIKGEIRVKDQLVAEGEMSIFNQE